jgi:hypothetical protein
MYENKKKQPRKLFFTLNNKKVLRILGNHILVGHKQDSHKMDEDTRKMGDYKLKHFLIIRQLIHPKMAAQSQ